MPLISTVSNCLLVKNNTSVIKKLHKSTHSLSVNPFSEVVIVVENKCVDDSLSRLPARISMSLSKQLQRKILIYKQHKIMYYGKKLCL